MKRNNNLTCCVGRGRGTPGRAAPRTAQPLDAAVCLPFSGVHVAAQAPHAHHHHLLLLLTFLPLMLLCPVKGVHSEIFAKYYSSRNLYRKVDVFTVYKKN